MDSTRSTPPPSRVRASLGGAGGGASSRRGAASLKHQVFEGGSSPVGPDRSHRDLLREQQQQLQQGGGGGVEGVVASRKPRPPTAHQLAVERNRSQRVEYILDRGLRRQHHKARKTRRQDGAVYRAYMRATQISDPFDDSDADEGRSLLLGERPAGPFRERGLGGLGILKSEDDDFGEEVTSYAAAFRRVDRRLDRWAAHADELGVIPAIKRRKLNGINGDGSGGAGVDDDDGDGDGDGDGNQDDDQDDQDDRDNTPKMTNGRGSRMSAAKAKGKGKARAKAVTINGHGRGNADADVTMDDADDVDDTEIADKTAVEEDDDDDDNNRDDEELDQVDRSLLGMDDGIESEA
jgi:Ino eighty subunit 1